MAKKHIDMSKLKLGKAKPIIKKTTTTGDEAVEKIHQEVRQAISIPTTTTEKITTPPINKVAEGPSSTKQERKKKLVKTKGQKKDLVRITVDVLKPLHKRIKIKALNQEITIRDYIISLVEADLKKK